MQWILIFHKTRLHVWESTNLLIFGNRHHTPFSLNILVKTHDPSLHSQEIYIKGIRLLVIMNYLLPAARSIVLRQYVVVTSRETPQVSIKYLAVSICPFLQLIKRGFVFAASRLRKSNYKTSIEFGIYFILLY